MPLVSRKSKPDVPRTSDVASRAPGVQVIVVVCAALGGLSSFGTLVALVDSKALTRIFAAILFLALLANARRIDVHIRLGKYLRKPGAVAAEHRADQRSLNRHVKANIVLTGLGSVAAIAMFVFPETPLLCKAVPELVLYGAFAYIELGTAQLRRNLPYIKGGTQLIEETRHGRNIREGADAEFKDDETGLALWPVRKIHEFLTQTDRSARTSATVLAIAFVFLVIPIAEVVAYFAHRTVVRDAPDAKADQEQQPDGQAPIAGGERLGSRGEPPVTRPSEQPLDSCEQSLEAGAGAPARQSGELLALWNGRAGRRGVDPIDSYGWDEAGCPTGSPWAVVDLEVDDQEVWVQEGYCGTLRGLGVSAPGRAPAMLLQQAAEFGRGQAKAGRLSGAWRRIDIGDGDMFVIDVTMKSPPVGSYVLVRSRKSSGRATDRSASLPCSPLGDESVAYSVVAPGMLPLWRQIVLEKGWAWPDDGGIHFPEGRDLAFVKGHSGREVAWASCTSEWNCTARLAGGKTFTTTDTLASPTLVTSPEEIGQLRALALAAPQP